MSVTKNLKSGWVLPLAPVGFEIPTVVLINGEWHLDFSKDRPHRVFAGDAGIEQNISWPWIEGFSPVEEDWQAIGFSVAVVNPLPCSECGRDLYDDSPVCTKCDPEMLEKRGLEVMDHLAAGLYGQHFVPGGRTVQ